MRRYLFTLGCVLLATVAAWLVSRGATPAPQATHTSLDVQDRIDWFDPAAPPSGHIDQVATLPQGDTARVVLAPHDEADVGTLAEFYQKLSASLESIPKTIVVAGPDHFAQSDGPVLTTSASWQLESGLLEADREVVNFLTQAPTEVVARDEPFRHEHSIFLHLPFLAAHFPGSRIVPLIVPNSSPAGRLKAISEQLTTVDSLLLIGSVDFYHGSSPTEAALADAWSWRGLADPDPLAVRTVDSDSGGVLTLLRLTATNLDLPDFTRLGRTTSQAATNTQFTTHVYGTFTKELLTPPPAILTFTGDVMLDRYVDERFTQRGPVMFEALQVLAATSDKVIVNHEGTFPDEDRPQSLQSLSFSFRRPLVEALRERGASIAGLANNHSLGFGPDALDQTRRNLAGLGFEVFGAPTDELVAGEPFTLDLSGQTVRLYGYSAFGQTVQAVSDRLRDYATDPGTDIVYVHWGNEYQAEPSAAQRDAAKAFVEAGADAIVGHHPHVVQPAETIDKTLVFYSLGNFIFDQDFSESTQHGLAVTLIIAGDTIQAVPRPIRINQSAPALLPQSALTNQELFPGFRAEQILVRQ